jgi:hypothetical protein
MIPDSTFAIVMGYGLDGPWSYTSTLLYVFMVKKKAIPITGLGGLQGCEILGIPHYLDSRLIDGGKVVSPTHQLHFSPQKHYYFSVSGSLIF